MQAQPARESSGAEARTSCEAVSALAESCNEKASIYCEQCERWYCASHARDEEWHPCGLDPGEEGGEG